MLPIVYGSGWKLFECRWCGGQCYWRGGTNAEVHYGSCPVGSSMDRRWDDIDLPRTDVK